MSTWSAPQPVVLPGSTSWTVDREGRPWQVDVCLPEGDGPFPVLYVLDGPGTFVGTATIAQVLGTIMRGAVEPVAVVGVGPAVGPGIIDDAQRFWDFTPSDHLPERFAAVAPRTGGADAFLDWLLDEVVPHVESRHPLRSDDRALAGWSLSGLLTCHALLTRTESFRRYVAVSPSLWWHDGLLLDRVGELPSGALEGKELFVVAGEHEGASWAGQFPPLPVTDDPTPLPDIVAEGTAFAKAAERAGARAHAEELAGESHGTIWWNAACRAVVHLYGQRP